MRLFLSALLFSASATSGVVAQAQGPSGVSIVDSANVARSAWARAVAALRARDLPGARHEVEHSVAAWPTQHEYVWAGAVIAARAGDTTGVFDALAAYADLGLGRDLTADTSIARFARHPRFASVATRHNANRKPLAHSRVVAKMADSTFWAEGVDYDPRTRRYYVASIRHRTIAELAPGGATREIWSRGQRGFGAVLGVRVDTARGVLWATMAGIQQMNGFTPADSAIAALVRVRISDGAIERRWDFAPSSRGHVLGDLAVGPKGDVFVTDSNEPFLYRLRPGSDTLERIRSPLFRSLQGLAPTPDGRVLYLADYSHGLLRVDLATNGVIRLDDAPHSTSLGVDGIVWDRGAIIAVQNGVAPARVMRFELNPSGWRIVRAQVLDRNTAIADEPTIGTIVGREFVYVANSQWEKHDADGRPKPSVHRTGTVLLAVPLPDCRCRPNR